MAAVRRLINLGHRRIVLVVRQERRAGGPGRVERAFLREMEQHGIQSGPYHLPDWEDGPVGFHRLLDELFRVTPPTALILDGAYLFAAAQQHLAQRGVLAPQDVSLVCTAPDPTFAWCQPMIAHIRYDLRPVLRRVVRWADNVVIAWFDRWGKRQNRRGSYEPGTVTTTSSTYHPARPTRSSASKRNSIWIVPLAAVKAAAGSSLE